MITTKVINVNLDKGQAKLNRVTTKDIDASIKVEQPKNSIKSPIVTTANLPDVANIEEKRRRDAIMAERKADTDDGKKLAMKEKMVKVRAAKGKKK